MQNITNTIAVGVAATENSSSVFSVSEHKSVPVIRSLHPPEPVADFSCLPREVRHEIYGWATRPVQLGTGLHALAKTSKFQRADVLDFMVNDERGIAFRQALQAVQTGLWHDNAKALLGKADKLRMAFGISSKRLISNAEEGVSGQAAIDALSKYSAVQFCLRHVVINFEISQLIRSVRSKPVKMDASGIGRERYLNELVPALGLVNPDCPLILDLSNNELRTDDLLPLLAFIKKSPIIYQLDLRNNFLCDGEEASLPLVALCKLVSPLSHLYLSNTAFNDASARCIAPILNKNPCLMHLDLRYNTLTEAGALSVIKAVGYQTASGQWQVNRVLTAVRLQKNNFVMSDTISRAIVELQSALDGDHKPGNDDSISEVGVYVVQVDDINFAHAALNQLTIFYQEIFSKNASAESL